MDILIKLLEFPSSLILAVAYLLLLYIVHRFWGESRVVRKLSGVGSARILLAVGAVLFGIEGVWSVPVHTSVPFAIYLLLLMFSLGQTLLRGLKRRAGWGFILNHLGIFLIVWAAFFGAPDVSRTKMVLAKGWAESEAYTKDGNTVPLPFRVELNSFDIDYYDDGESPRQFTSTITIDGKRMETSVNSPCYYRGYTIFQDGYDHESGRYSILQLVRDPWLPVVYIGMALLAMGSVLLLFGKWRARVTVPVTVVLTVLFTAVTVAKINFGTLMPALRSWWFVPHLFIYMVAYSLMALALVAWVWEWKKKRDVSLSDSLTRSSSALIIIGMLTGSVWARQAWGDYWAWDAKENWAAVTWLIVLMMLHLPQKGSKWAITILVLAFLALQITWYGVDYLPSAENSMHSYRN